MQIVLLSTCVCEMVNLKTLYNLLDIVPNVELSIITYTTMKFYLYSQIKGAEAEAAIEELTNQSGDVKRKASTERDLYDRIANLEQDLRHREMTVRDLRVSILSI